MNDLELIFTMLGEASTTKIARNKDAINNWLKLPEGRVLTFSNEKMLRAIGLLSDKGLDIEKLQTPQSAIFMITNYT
jgi:hypothetical protein